jgi:hypothetical protein
VTDVAAETVSFGPTRELKPLNLAGCTEIPRGNQLDCLSLDAVPGYVFLSAEERDGAQWQTRESLLWDLGRTGQELAYIARTAAGTMDGSPVYNQARVSFARSLCHVSASVSRDMIRSSLEQNDISQKERIEHQVRTANQFLRQRPDGLWVHISNDPEDRPVVAGGKTNRLAGLAGVGVTLTIDTDYKKAATQSAEEAAPKVEVRHILRDNSGRLISAKITGGARRIF